MKILGLIPARKGSKRIPGKNMALLNGQPLLRYTVDEALKSDIFDKIIVSTDWDMVASFVETEYSRCMYDTNIWILRRPPELCTDAAHDYQWVRHALDHYPDFDIFVILRPTSPFRTAETIRNAFRVFDPACDSVRAVGPTKSHPGKSWTVHEDGKAPVTDEQLYKIEPFFLPSPFCFVQTYDLPTQSLDKVYCQNACIQIAHTGVVEKYKNVTGVNVIPYFTTGNEGIDINEPSDLAYAEWIMRGKP